MTTAPAELSAGESRAARRAVRLLWLVVTIVVLDVVVGGGWDAEYHRTEPFDGFFSPPHLFIYSVATIALALVAYMVMSPSVRTHFAGSAFPGADAHAPARAPVRTPAQAPVRTTAARAPMRVPDWASVPSGLVLLAGGMAGLALAAPLDAIWHTRFGLDETPWSLPHAMLGASLLMIALGIVASRLAVTAVPIRPWTLPLLVMLMLFGTLTLLGPFGNASPDAVAAASRQGALATDAAAQRLFEIYLSWNLTRTNPVFVALGAAWACFAIALTRPFVRRTLVWLAVLLVFGWIVDAGTVGTARELGLSDDPATTAGLPLIWAAIPVALLRDRPRAAALAAGAVFGLVAYAQWGWRDSPGLGLVALAVAPLAGLAAARAGSWTADVVRAPASRAPRLVIAVVLVWPVLTGTIDLALRRST